MEIYRSTTIIQGQGVRRTLLQARFSQDKGKPRGSIRPRLCKVFSSENVSEDKIENVQLSNFTLEVRRVQLFRAIPNTAALQRAEDEAVQKLTRPGCIVFCRSQRPTSLTKPIPL
ncbi:hypothetical protein NDA03_04770 [Trichocoleus sp. Lan]|uniref:hypothetical protein n=1 Tax=Cyanophyceae TaxID=3028117 RepID=UPI00168A2A82|nr:hypothetical protein [Coleofasciculus sp. FACHB-542]MBD2087155.1 hypothetical protein [Coleofasciculus sp. FACHB-542]